MALIIIGKIAAAQPWSPELQHSVYAFGEVLPSPSGKVVAWTEQATNGSNRLVVSGRTVPNWTARARGLAWSADEQYLYFQAADAEFRLRLSGDSVGAPERISLPSTATGEFRLSPDGTQLAFLDRVENPGKSRIRMAGVPRFALRICLAPVDGKNAPRCPVAPKGFASELEWSPDGRTLAFETRPTPLADDSRKADIAEADLATGTIRQVTATGATERSPRYSPDGRYLAFIKSEDPPLQPGDDRIAIWNRETGAIRELAPTDDRLPEILGWTSDSKSVYFSEARGTRNVIYALPLDAPPRLVFAPDGIFAAARLNRNGSTFGLSLESPGVAPEAFRLETGSSSRPVQISRTNAGLPVEKLGRTEVVWWRSKGNVEVEGLLTYPEGYVTGTKYPMVVVLHGGPYGRFAENFIGRGERYPLATFAARGFAVFRPNPRASTGYGRDFRYLNLKDWGGGDFDDVVTGVRSVSHVADLNRLAIMGWSYGGYLTSWTISHSDLFKAACVGAGVSNLWSQTGTSDIRSNKVDAFGAPWENLSFYVDRSPLAHVARINIPVLILGGEADERVPISQSYELFHALQRRGVPSQMVVYPGAGHSPREPEYVIDIMQRHLDWVEQHLGKR